MATPTFNAANSSNVYDAGATSYTLASFALNAGTDRFLEVWVANGGAASAPVPTGVTWGGQAMTQRGSITIAATTFILSKWYIASANFPGGATGDIVASWSSSQLFRGIVAMGYNDVNQSSPYRNVSETTQIDYTDTTPDLAVSSNTDDLVAAGLCIISDEATMTTLSVSAGTERTETTIISSTVAMGGATIAGAATATIEWTRNGTNPGSAMMLGDSLQGGSLYIPRSMLLGVG